MRNRSLASACLLATFATAAFAAYILPAQTAVHPPAPELHARAARVTRFFSFRYNQVIANLLTETPARSNDLKLSIMAGEISRCESRTCQVPLTIRVAEAQGPVSLAFAVANSKGELSDVHHAECGTGNCNIALIVERGRNTVSVGAVDGVTQSSGYTTVQVNATHAVAVNGKTEWF
ncbi:MAG: hypothetical protein DMF57_16860 [Acidobacteria bacterium]|nr:MAG: hypothetical protein DMF57_16860 [Acidobacteriota bacterium]